MARNLTLTAVLAMVLGGLVPAQTLGIPCCNDYTINAFGSGTTSCTLYVNPPASPLVFSVNTFATGTAVYYAFSCQCMVNSLVFPGCCGAINSVDIDLSCLLVPLVGPFIPTVNSAGCATHSLTVGFCPPFFTFTTQALIIDPTCPVGFRTTQAFDVFCL